MPLLQSPLGVSRKTTLTRVPIGCMTQGFSENPALYANMGITGHNGIDLILPYGSPLFNALTIPSKVVEIKEDTGGYGKHIRIITCDKYQGFWWHLIYGHLSKIQVKQGQFIKPGELVGQIGNTGFVVSSPNANGYWLSNPYGGTHLHLGLRKLSEPIPFTAQTRFPTGETFTIPDYNNGYLGYYDPCPFFFDEPLTEIWAKVAELWKQFTILKNKK